jgi:hypothetical protein
MITEGYGAASLTAAIIILAGVCRRYRGKILANKQTNVEVLSY